MFAIFNTYDFVSSPFAAILLGYESCLAGGLNSNTGQGSNYVIIVDAMLVHL
jgi:hypothetical protein